MKIKIAILIVLLYTLSCQNDQDELRITGISAVSSGSDTLLSVPDSLLVTFNHNNNELQMIGRYFGCNPIPTAHCQWNLDTLLILFKMNDQCIHDIAEHFEIKLSVASINKKNFRLIWAPTHGEGWTFFEKEYKMIDSLISVDYLR